MRQAVATSVLHPVRIKPAELFFPLCLYSHLLGLHFLALTRNHEESLRNSGEIPATVRDLLLVGS